MKYIRTTNNIYQDNQSGINKVRFIEKNDEEYFCLSINLGYSADGFLMTRNERIIKESDNLKDLCDAYVFICDDFTKPEWVIPMNFDYCKKYFKHTEIYGGIWTHAGFIYVAKMNKEGEFEYYEDERRTI